jgi:predicted nucleotidyltransferase
MNILSGNIDKIKALCDQFHVRSLFAFGSVTNNSFKSSSDIDLVVDIESEDPLSYSDYYFGLKFQLEKLFQRQIDLLESRSIKNPFLKNKIDNTKILVYGKGN